jgi:DNA-directed RNA polymerase subunit RPC12/RpoP
MLNIIEEPNRSPAYYREQWRLYYEERNRRVARLGVLLGITGALALLFALVPNSFQIQHPVFANTIAVIGGVLWLTIGFKWFALNWTMGSWDCPRCGEPFFASTFVRNPFGTRCRHCKLRRLRKSELGEIQSTFP